MALIIRPLPIETLQALYGADQAALIVHERQRWEGDLVEIGHTHPVAAWSADRIHLLKAEIRRLNRDIRLGYPLPAPGIDELPEQSMVALRALGPGYSAVRRAVREIEMLEDDLFRLRAGHASQRVAASIV